MSVMLCQWQAGAALLIFLFPNSSSVYPLELEEYQLLLQCTCLVFIKLTLEDFQNRY